MRKIFKASYFLLAVTLIAGNVVAQQKPQEKENASEVDQLEEARKTCAEFKEEWPSIAKHTTPEWFMDAKFGIFTCIGPATLATQHRRNNFV